MNGVDAASAGATLYYRGLRACGATTFRRLTKNAGLILCYHNVVWGDADVAGHPAMHITLARFERQVRWLLDHYDVLSLSTFVDRLVAGAPLTETAVITFDDGYAGVFDYAVPLLDDLDVPATVFVIASAPGRSRGFWWDCPQTVSLERGNRDRWVTSLRGDDAAILADVNVTNGFAVPPALWPADWSAIRAAAGGQIEIGVHSATHRTLTVLDDAELQEEIVTSRQVVQQETGITPTFFSYPYGHWDARVRSAVQAVGYRASLTLATGLNDATADPWSLRRINVPGAIADAAFEAWAAGLQLRRI
ncbi:MAG TPA: polysaccharide deacetylase family protein [Vicinamibacterales bacterium]|nr:polysaccharide deacetylase family protein [Vicinamibacterales bacterium]